MPGPRMTTPCSGRMPRLCSPPTRHVARLPRRGRGPGPPSYSPLAPGWGASGAVPGPGTGGGTPLDHLQGAWTSRGRTPGQPRARGSRGLETRRGHRCRGMASVVGGGAAMVRALSGTPSRDPLPNHDSPSRRGDPLPGGDPSRADGHQGTRARPSTALPRGPAPGPRGPLCLGNDRWDVRYGVHTRPG